jgi:competence protein ComEC
LDISHLWIKFWERHPFLFLGLNFLFISLIVSFSSYVYFIPLLLLWIPFRKKAYKLSLLLPFITFIYLYSPSESQIQTSNEKEKFSFCIQSIETSESRFSKDLYLYKGFLNQKNKKIPVSTIHSSSKLFSPGYTYDVKGVLKENDQGNYHLKLDHKFKVKKKHLSSNLNLKRDKAHKKLKSWLNKKCQSKENSSFIYSLLTGKLSNRLSKFLFSKYQLIHLLVISGFHLSLLTYLIYKTLSFFLNKRLSVSISMTILSLYFLFLGFSPSLFRAFITAIIFLFGIFLGRKAIGLNSLGLALIASILVDPKLLFHMGFQFSFLITASILLFFPLIRAFLLSKLKVKSKALLWILNLLTLSISVQIVAIPLSLLFFHKTSLLGIFLNIWFPILFSLLLYLLFFTLTLSFIPYLSSALFFLSEKLSGLIIVTVELPWSIFEIPLRVSSLSPALTVILLSILFFTGILYQCRTREYLSLPI